MSKCIDAISVDITQWLKFSLRLWGKINVINMNITSRLMHILRGMPVLILIRYTLYRQIS